MKSPSGKIFLFFGGKGGVGKTTCAAMTALRLASRRSAVVSLDPAHSLGDVLGMKLSERPTPVPSRGGRLDAIELDADRALARWLRARRAALEAVVVRGTYLDDSDIQRMLDLSLPGVDELIGLVELMRIAEVGRYETVVVDTAPTGHTLRLLRMPESLERVAAVLEDMEAKHRVIHEQLTGSYRPDEGDAVIEEIAWEAERTRELLRDPERARFTWVVLPEAMAIEEARTAVSELAELGVRAQRVLVNRVTVRASKGCAGCAGRVAEEGKAIARIEREFEGIEVRAVGEVGAEPRGVGALGVLKEVGIARVKAGANGRARAKAKAKAKAKASARARGDARARVTWVEEVVPEGCRLLLVGGKGGVGKTTCAATIAIEAGERGRRVLLLSTDPAHSLGDVFGADVGDAERSIEGAPETLRVRELDAERAFAREKERFQDAIDALFDRILPGSRLDASFDRAVMRDLIDLAPPGLDELLAVMTLLDALFPAGGRRGRDLVVVDTAPTGHTLRLLALPGAALEWVHAVMAVVLKYRHAIGLGELASDLVGAAKRLRRLEQLLRDPRRARFAVVTRGARVVVDETNRLVAGLGKLGVAASSVIVNALTAGTCRRCAEVARAELGEIRAIRVRGAILLRAPAVYPVPHGVAALRSWGESWDELDATGDHQERDVRLLRRPERRGAQARPKPTRDRGDGAGARASSRRTALAGRRRRPA